MSAAERAVGRLACWVLHVGDLLGNIEAGIDAYFDEWDARDAGCTDGRETSKGSRPPGEEARANG